MTTYNKERIKKCFLKSILKIRMVLFVAGIKWMDKIQRENIAHLLATMHIVLRQQDGQEKGTGQYHHVTNTSYEKFVER